MFCFILQDGKTNDLALTFIFDLNYFVETKFCR